MPGMITRGRDSRDISTWEVGSLLPYFPTSILSLIAQRLPCLQGVRDAFQRLRFPTEAEERLALEIKNLILRKRCRMRHVAARQNPGEFAADDRVVLADAASAKRQVHTQRQRGEYARPSH